MRFAFDDDGSRSFGGDESDETDLDRDFPLGDGTADTSADVACPYCGETNTVGVDPGSGDVQNYVEDCQVCCQPIELASELDESGELVAVRATRSD